MSGRDYIKLNTGNWMPPIGYGTWQIIFNVRKKVLTAIETGYRLIDTAKIYGNETGVGAAIQKSGVGRQELFVTTKLWNSDQGKDKAMAAFDESLKRLGLEYVDLYLIHWPSRETDKRQQSWQILEEIYNSGRAKAIGVSNYKVEHLEELMTFAKVRPAVNQIEFHPYIYEEQKPTLEYCKKHDIIVEAYSPLAHGRHKQEEVIAKVAEKHQASSAQVMLAWAMWHGTVPIPKTTNPDRMKENLAATDLVLTVEDMSRLSNLSRGEHVIGLH